MNDNDRFGLSLSLVEALRVDPSPDAVVLADLLVRADPPPRTSQKRSRRMAMVGLAVVALGVGVHGYAAAQTLEGRWTMAPGQSSFQESATGAAPDAAVMTVTRDNPAHLAYQLSESRQGVEVARAAYDVSFTGAPSTSRVGGAKLGVTAQRDDHGDVVIQAPPVGAYRAVIHVRRSGPDSVLLEHDVEGAGQSITLEAIRLVRTPPAPPTTGWAQASAVGSATKDSPRAR